MRLHGPHARVGRVLAEGGYVDGPKGGAGGVARFFLFYDRSDRYIGWCRATTIEAMVEAGLLKPQPAASAMIIWRDATELLRRALKPLLESGQ